MKQMSLEGLWLSDTLLYRQDKFWMKQSSKFCQNKLAIDTRTRRFSLKLYLLTRIFPIQQFLPLDHEVIIPFTTPTYSPLISPLELEETMNLGTETDSKAKKVKLNLLKPFNGKHKNLKMFLQDSQMYILINAEIYNTDLKKIALMLSLMAEGDTASWKQQLIEETLDQALLAGTDPDFGTFGNFISSLKEAFEPYDSEANALEEMKALRIGDMPIDEHIAKYKMLVTKAKLRDDNPIVIDLFQETLTVSLQWQLLSLEKPPKSLKE